MRTRIPKTAISGANSDQADDGAEDIDAALHRVVEGVVQRQLTDAEHGHAVEAFDLQAGDEDLEAARHQLEVRRTPCRRSPRAGASGGGPCSHHAMIRSAPELRTSSRRNHVPPSTGTSSGGSDSSYTIRRQDHAVDIDLLRAAFAEALDSAAAFLVPADEDGPLAQCVGKGIAPQRTIEEPAPGAEHHHGDHAATRSRRG